MGEAQRHEWSGHSQWFARCGVDNMQVINTYQARMMALGVSDVDFRGKNTLKSDVTGTEGAPSPVGMKTPVPIFQ